MPIVLRDPVVFGSGLCIRSMARRGHLDNLVAFREYNNVLPIMAVATRKAATHSLVFFKIVLIHDSTIAVITALAGVRIGAIKLTFVAATSLRGACGSMARVCLESVQREFLFNETRSIKVKDNNYPDAAINSRCLIATI